MVSLACSPNDPFFYIHHCFVDKLVEMLKDTVSPSQWYYPRDVWWMPTDHSGNERMWPFDYRNRDGLDDELIGKDYMYEPSPADETCFADADCSPPSTRLLWCDTSSGTGECKAKCRPGGRCTTGIHAMCYCADENASPRCDAGTCRC